MVTFPGFGLSFSLSRVAFTVLGRPIYWYGIIIAAGFLLAAFYSMRRAPEFGVLPDDVMDMLFFAVPLCIVGARLYYVIFYLDLFRRQDGTLDFMQMVRVWDGGVAIYGAVIMGVLVGCVFTRVRGFSFGAYADMASFGLFIGQAVGRWGNFFNIEAYGSETALPWRMGVYEWTQSGVYKYMEVHPTFLYESLWNLAGLALLVWLSKKGRRKFDGMLFLTYVAWYGLGRGFIEGLRTDSLYFFGLTLGGAPLRTSQVLGFLSSLAAGALLFYHLRVKRHMPQELYVNRRRAAEEAAAQPDAARREAADSQPEQCAPREQKEEDLHGGNHS